MSGKMRSTGAKRLCRTMKRFSYSLLLLLINVSFINSLEVTINEDFYQQQQEEINPCDFMSANDDPSGFCFCTPDDMSAAETVKCGFHKTPSDKEWNAISLLKTATVIEIVNRPALVITEAPPPHVFTGMTSLLYFTIKMTALHNIPAFAFGNSSSLKEVDIQSNNVHSLSSHAFSHLHNLTVIKLNDNNLTEINRNVFVDLPNLRELLLMKNGIQIVHDYALKDLMALKDLSLRDNRVSVITREVFSGLSKMENLDLHGNTIEYIGDHVFADMPRLQDLDLSENMIKSVSSMAFQGLYKLHRLNLRNNKIVRFQPSTFARLDKIYFLDLKNNELETLNEELVKPIYKNLRDNNMQLYLEGNRFLCDCRIFWMKALYNETESSYVKHHIGSVTCNMFENTNKKDASVASPSSTLFHTDSDASDIKIVTSPPEETATYAFESEKYILNLTAKELKCHKSGAEIDNGRDRNLRKKHEHDGTDGHRHPSQNTPFSTYHHHQQTVPKSPEEQVFDQSHKHKLLSVADWDTNSESHQRDHHGIGGISSEENPSVNAGVHRQLSSLNEPQATAALEGVDIGGSVPKRTSAGDQKVDTSRISSNYPENSSAGVRIPNCDSRFLITIVLSIFYITSILM